MARLGRPPATDSAATRKKVVDAARSEFATKGYAATSVTAVAEAAGLAPSAIYHYFGGKAELYGAVFDVTVSDTWGALGQSAAAHETLHESVAAMIDSARHIADDRPHHSSFLALVPIEARLHDDFSHLLDRRSKYQDDTFGGLAELGRKTGEIVGLTHIEATEILRSLIMGWFFERHFRRAEIPGSGEAIMRLLTRLGSS